MALPAGANSVVYRDVASVLETKNSFSIFSGCIVHLRRVPGSHMLLLPGTLLRCPPDASFLCLLCVGPGESLRLFPLICTARNLLMGRFFSRNVPDEGSDERLNGRVSEPKAGT